MNRFSSSGQRWLSGKSRKLIRRRQRGGSFRKSCARQPTNKICKSIKLVCVGPVTIRSPVALRKLQESFDCKYFIGANPNSTPREHVKGSTMPPAAVVGPSDPSLATLAKQAVVDSALAAMEIAHASAIS